MEPLYSVLLCNQQYSEYKERISKWLAKGIKVIWFGQDENVVDELKTTFKKYAKVVIFEMAAAIRAAEKTQRLDTIKEAGNKYELQ